MVCGLFQKRVLDRRIDNHDMILASGRVSSTLRALNVAVHSATAPCLICQSRVAENSTLASNAARRVHEANVMARPVGAGLVTPDFVLCGCMVDTVLSPICD